MISFSVIKENIIEAGKRILKVQQFGAKTADSVSSFGDDSSPLKDMIAIYANTSEVGDSIIIGYINENQIAKPGEKRIFSLDSNGNLATSIHLKNDGTIELDGNTHNAVRLSPLQASLQSQVSLINAELTKIAAGITTAGGVYVPTPVTIDISAAKSDKVKIS